MERTEPHTLVIGSGIIGLSLAWVLANRGGRVSVVDSGNIARGASSAGAASWAGAGMLPSAANRCAVDPYEQLKSLSHRLHPQWAEELSATTGIDTGFRRSGGIYIARTPAEAATLAASRLWWDEHAIKYEQLDRHQLAQLEPRLAATSGANGTSAWLLPDEYQLRNPHHMQALRAASEQLGVNFLEQTTIVDFVLEGNRLQSLRTEDGQRLSADQYCICSGAWARQALEQFGIANGIMPVRGQIVLYRCDQQPISHVINEGNRYLVPRTDGRVLAGSVEEEVGYVCETTREAVTQVRSWAEDILPSLATTKVERTWAGLRPGSFDGLPYLGRVPEIENLFLAAGHFRSGVHLSCATAEVMANLMLGGENTIDLTPFRVGRG